MGLYGYTEVEKSLILMSRSDRTQKRNPQKPHKSSVYTVNYKIAQWCDQMCNMETQKKSYIIH